MQISSSSSPASGDPLVRWVVGGSAIAGTFACGTGVWAAGLAGFGGGLAVAWVLFLAGFAGLYRRDCRREQLARVTTAVAEPEWITS